MKKLILYLVCLIGYISSIGAQEIEHYIGAESTRKNSSFPVYEYYNYSMREFIYLAEEMGDGALVGDITSISFLQAEKRADVRKFSVYIKHTDKENFLNGNDLVRFTEDDCYLKSTDVTYPGVDKEWAVLTLDKPFKYEGGNIVVGLFDETGSFKDASKFYSYVTSKLRRCIGHDRDAAPYDIAYPGVMLNFVPYIGRNEMPVTRFTFKAEEDYSVITIDPKEIDLGYRPNNAWMEPYEITVGTKGNPLTVHAVDVSDPYFELTDIELPATITITKPITLGLSHGVGQGEKEGQIGISLDMARTLEFIDVKATGYNPIVSDVWEMAEPITSYPFTATPDLINIYNNYRLPGDSEDGKDVVYELNFDRDVMLNANVVGTNGKIAVYAEDFNGKGGPAQDNVYVPAHQSNSKSNISENSIEGLGLSAGKYYLVVSSTSDFTVNVDTENIPLPLKAYNPSPADFANNVYRPTLSWSFGEYTVEYQVLFGSTFPPQEVLVDWTDELETSETVGDLYNNTQYFWQINARNSSGTTYGDIWGFTTELLIPQNLTALNDKIYEGETATIVWEGVNNRSHLGYNVYVEFNYEYDYEYVKMNATPIADTSYTFTDLSYNMKPGHRTFVTAVYDEGESDYSFDTYIKVTGMGAVAGTVYEQDEITPITTTGIVIVEGEDEFGVSQSYTFPIDETGSFAGELLAGEYQVTSVIEGYTDKTERCKVTYGNTADINIAMTEVYNPVAYIDVMELDETQVQAIWGMQKYGGGGEDFETGDFSANEWNNTVSEYPWVIVEGGNESDYAMRSNCAGVDYGVSAIEITVEVPFDGFMSFDYKISSEQAYDLGKFYIDGTTMASFSGEAGWATKKVAVTEGVHVYRWEYSKDIMWESGEDAFYVDNIEFCFEPEPFTGGWLHYDDGVYATSIGTGQPSPCYWGISFPASAEYAGYTINKVAVYDASPDYAGTYTANIYVGGTDAPGTLVSSQAATLTGTGDFAEIELSTPVTIDATQPFWITIYTADLTFPAAGCSYAGDPNSDWISLDGIAWDHAGPTYGLEYSWMVRAYLENAKGETAILTTSSKAPKFEGGASTGTFVAAENVTPKYVGVPANTTETGTGNRAFDSYNLYRKNIHTEEVVKLLENTADTSYVDNDWASIEAGAYQWGVSAMYAGNREIKTYFAESFEGGVVPEGWTIHNTSAEGHESHIIDRQIWKPVKNKSSNGQMFYPAEGDYFLQGDEDGFLTYQGVWDLDYGIITPAINVLPSSVLEMAYINPSYEHLASWRSNIDVRISNSIDGPWTTLWTTNNTMTMDWLDLEIDLGEYAGQTVYLMFAHHALSDWGWFAGIDDVKITSYYPESEILWSETVDKDMTTTVTVSAETNNGDPVKGTKVSFVNMLEEGFDFEASLDETGIFTFDDFRKGTYEMTVTKNGFTSDVDGEIVEIWDASVFNVMLTESLAAVEGLYVSPTGWAMWQGGAVGSGDEFAYSFEDGMEGWTTIDANNDAHTWYHNSLAGDHSTLSADSHTGTGHVCSESYCNATWTSMEPDDYIVSPTQVAIGGGSVLRFWACAQDANYQAEHFGVAISTSSNTSAADFTTVSEWTIGSKVDAKGAARGDRDATPWVQYEVDLSEYAGQSVWIAIRHFGCYDQFILLVDDIELTNSAKDGRALTKYQVMLDDVVENDSLTVPYFQHENLVDGRTYTTTVIANYTSGEGEAVSYTWTKAPDRLFAGVKNLNAVVNNGANTVDLSWTLPSEEVEPGPGTTFTYGFENDMEGWTNIDADGDGNVWKQTSDFDAHTGNSIVYSESYINYIGALNPDNYLVSPQKYMIAEGSMISFYACAQDENYPYEHFSVEVSTAENTSADDFTTVSEWTISAKGSRQGDRTMRQSSWIKYEADLSEYAGQEIYVALRHFNCTDQFYLNVDDIEIFAASETDSSKEGNWMHYDNGSYADGVGGPASFYWGIKLRPEELGQYSPAGLTKVAIFDKIETNGEFHIYLGGENAPGELMHTQEYVCTGINDFVEYELTETIPVYGSESVWVVFHTNDGANFPASCCNNTGDADGRWISMDGNTWQDLVAAGLSYTWMIRAYVDDEAMPEDNTPAIAEILGVHIYRNGELLSSKPIIGESYTDKNGVDGDEYCLKVVYGGGVDTTYYAMSSYRCTTADFTLDCVAPVDLFAEQTGNDEVTLKLSYNPNPVGDWLYYDNGTNEDAIGGPASFYWGIMFPSESLAAYAGTSMTKVSLFDYSASSGDILVYYGGTNAPGELVHSQPYSVNGTGAFVEFDLTAALPIDPTMNVWIAFSTSQGASYPAAVSANTGDPNGRWISMDGSVWEDILDYGLSNTWMMRAYVTNAKGEAVALSAITDYEYTTSTGEVKAAGAARATSELTHYNVYRGTSENNMTVIGETSTKTYVDSDVAEGTYYYAMTAVYEEGGETCESDPANAYGSDETFVVVTVTSIDENGVEGMMIYPNPTKDNVTISAEGIERITITNALGQVMLDRVVNSDSEILNMGQYEAGVYMVRIVTANGVATERITVL